MDIITYSLKVDKENSDRYYRDIAVFADEVSAKLDSVFNAVIKGYKSYLKNRGLKVKTEEEYGLELLILSVIWEEHCADAAALEDLPAAALDCLNSARRRSQRLKPIADFAKGILGTIYLFNRRSKNVQEIAEKESYLKGLVGWMKASGEYTHEVRELEGWVMYLAACGPHRERELLQKVLDIAGWFKERGREVLGGYTAWVEDFLQKSYQKHLWKENVVFCGKRPVEYHLNMVGAEIMSKACREEFKTASEKIVLLPACMRGLPPSQCGAVETEEGLACTHCTKACEVNQISRLGAIHHFKVRIIPHESRAFNDKPASPGEVGVVGVACILNLLEGGFRAKGLNMAPQCVLLDYCGCRKHWHPEGIATSINLAKLKSILEI